MSISHAQSAPAPADANAILDEGVSDERTNPLAPFTLRLHLIRHGETEANVANLVLGQGDSPLTQNGLDVAARAAASNLINGRTRNYWRMYCSDLYRAHRTARIVLGIEDVHGNILDSSINLVVDSRLRELAKGAREGYLKSLSYNEALEQRARHANGEMIEVPLLESINDAWERVKGWIDSLVLDAYDDFNSLTDDQKTQHECDVNTPKIYDVFALSHSALIRTMIHKMVDKELPADYAKTKEGSLSIPNLSISTIDVRPFDGGNHAFWRPSLVSLTDVSHLNQ
jgi:probable phosphoglycerate mutase